MPQEEDQVRWENAQVLTLHQLQDGLCLYASGKETESAKRVCGIADIADAYVCANAGPCRAKYIEGLENRLGRMESLLRLSGLLSQDDGGKTDLGTLEKRLADRSATGGVNTPNPSTSQQPATANANVSNQTANPTQPSTAPQSHQPSPQMDSLSMSPRTTSTSPGSQKESETEVEALSDMMCSLVTNNCGETRYIGNDAVSPLPPQKEGKIELMFDRVFVGIFHFLAKRYSMGQREDRRHVVPRYDLVGLR